MRALGVSRKLGVPAPPEEALALALPSTPLPGDAEPLTVPGSRGVSVALALGRDVAVGASVALGEADTSGETEGTGEVDRPGMVAKALTVKLAVMLARSVGTCVI